MRPQGSVSAVEVEWTKVSVKHPCVICSGHLGCLRGSDDEFACCNHVASEWPLSAGGWVHRVRCFVRAHTHADNHELARPEATSAMNVTL